MCTAIILTLATLASARNIDYLDFIRDHYFVGPQFDFTQNFEGQYDSRGFNLERQNTHNRHFNTDNQGYDNNKPEVHNHFEFNTEWNNRHLHRSGNVRGTNLETQNENQHLSSKNYDRKIENPEYTKSNNEHNDKTNFEVPLINNKNKPNFEIHSTDSSRKYDENINSEVKNLKLTTSKTTFDAISQTRKENNEYLQNITHIPNEVTQKELHNNTVKKHTDTAYTNSSVSDRENLKLKEIDEHRPSETKKNATIAGDKWIWSDDNAKVNTTTTVSPDLDNRDAFNGDKCATGMVRAFGKCVPVD